MQFSRCEQRESVCQWKTCLGPKHAISPRAGAVSFEFSLVQDETDEVEIFSHDFIESRVKIGVMRSQFGWNGIGAAAQLLSAPDLSLLDRERPTSCFATCAPAE